MKNNETPDIYYRTTILCESCGETEVILLYDMPNISKNPQERNKTLKSYLSTVWDCESCNGEQFTLQQAEDIGNNAEQLLLFSPS